jgi:hypothetical protein
MSKSGKLSGASRDSHVGSCRGRCCARRRIRAGAAALKCDPNAAVQAHVLPAAITGGEEPASAPRMKDAGIEPALPLRLVFHPTRRCVRPRGYRERARRRAAASPAAPDDRPCRPPSADAQERAVGARLAACLGEGKGASHRPP